VYLIEANAFPDFKQTGSRLNQLISVLFDQTVAVAIDPFFSQQSRSQGDGDYVRDNGKLHLVYDTQLFARK